MAAGGRNQNADAVEDTHREEEEEAGDHCDAWGDSGHVPQEVQVDIHHNREGMKDRGTAEEEAGGRQRCVVSAADLEVSSDYLDLFRVPSDEKIADEEVLNERMKEAAPLVRDLTRQLLMEVVWTC